MRKNNTMKSDKEIVVISNIGNQDIVKLYAEIVSKKISETVNKK